MLAPLAATAIVMRIIQVMRVMQVAIPRWPSYRPVGDARLNQSFRKDRWYRLSALNPTFVPINPTEESTPLSEMSG